MWGRRARVFRNRCKGTFNIGTTNLNLDVAKIRSPVLRQIVAIVAKLPDIAENPVSGAESLLSGISSSVLGKPSGSLADDVSKSPIDIITARGTASDGKVTVEQVVVRSVVFEADVTNGTVTLAPVLTNSTINLPIGILLSAPIVGRFPILAADNASTNGGYIRMPDFYVEKGTLGNPKPSISAVAFGKNLIQRVIPGVGGGTNGGGNILQRYWRAIAGWRRQPNGDESSGDESTGH